MTRVDYTTAVTLNANELRIGNTVADSDGRQGIVNVIYPDCIDVLFDTDPWRMYITNVRGVALTPEILVRCGFVKSSRHQFNNHDANGYVLGSVLIWMSWMDPFAWVNVSSAHIDGSYLQPEIKHLHQLQNLYFSLTNTELPLLTGDET